MIVVFDGGTSRRDWAGRKDFTDFCSFSRENFSVVFGRVWAGPKTLDRTARSCFSEKQSQVSRKTSWSAQGCLRVRRDSSS